MQDFISREAVLADIENTIENSGCVNHEGEIIDCVRYAKVTDVVPAVHGQWVDFGEESTWECSECNEPWTLITGTPEENRMHYCPNCGARMDLPEVTP